MPSSSYTLVFDGQTNPEKSTAVFNILQRDDAWQIALDERFTPVELSFSLWRDRRNQPSYSFEALPAMLRSITQYSPLIRCNFDPSVARNVDVIESKQEWTLKEWAIGWLSHEPPEFEADPLPSPYHDLRRWRKFLWY
jgi:hypothetical protein